MQPILLVCGVSGAGKTWICKQLVGRFNYIPHDEHYDDHADTLHIVSHNSKQPIITECPFGERVLRESLESRGIKVIPFFVIEAPHTVASRYFEREGKPIQKAALTRAESIINRAIEWEAPHGNSDEMLKILTDFTPPA